MMKKILSAMLCACLALSAFPALAAPTRDAKSLEVDVAGGMADELEIMISAILGPQWPDTIWNEQETEEESADQDIAQKTLAYLMARQGMNAVGRKEAAQLLAQVATEPGKLLGEMTDGTYLEKTEAGYALIPESINNGYRLGAYPYSAEFDGVNVRVAADIFYCPAEYEGTADELPEATLRWLMGARFDLKFAPETPFGYTVNSFALSNVFHNGDFSKWQEIENTEYEYSVNLPGDLGKAEAEPAKMTWQNAQGDVTVTIAVTEGAQTYEQALSRFIQNHPDEYVVQERMFDQFYVISEDCFDLMVVSADLNWAYQLTMTFPAELSAEYQLYAEIIRNSFIVWGISNG